MQKENIIRLAPGTGLRDRPALISAMKGERRLLMIVSAPGLKTLNRMQGMEAGDAMLADRAVVNGPLKRSPCAQQALAVTVRCIL